MNAAARTHQLWFTQPFSVEVRETALPAPATGQVRVRTVYSAISAGTELLLYRGQLPGSMALDESLESLRRDSGYPTQYGYACVGEVEQTGDQVDPAWQGCRVFSFQPHASHFLASPDQLKIVPDDISLRNAVFLPNMETAVNLVQDGRPLIGERAVVLGQGIVGLLLTGVLSRHPLAWLVAVEGQPHRQQLARAMGAETVYSPEEAAEANALTDTDLIYEVSGQPRALNLAITLSGYASRIVIGSWYGDKSAAIDLGGKAHRNRLELITSQVSTLAPDLSGRWDKRRRFQVAWEMIRRIEPARLVTHTASLQEADTIYRELHEQRSDIVQILFHYPD